jgi:hypothetical protein
MFRHQFHAEVKLGKFRDFHTTFEAFDGAVRARNLARPQLWAKSFGKINSVVIVREHESIEAYDTDNRAFLADTDCMNLWRELSQLVEATPWDELWETASQIA